MAAAVRPRRRLRPRRPRCPRRPCRPRRPGRTGLTPCSDSGEPARRTSVRPGSAPRGPLPVLVSGFGPKAAELAGRIGDGFVTMSPDADLVGAFRDGGGAGTKVVGGVKVCWRGNREKAVDVVHRLWPTEPLPGEPAQILPTRAHVEQAGELVTRDTVADAVTCGDEVEKHLKTVRAYARAGFDEVYVGQIGPDQEMFFDAYRELVLPALQR
ncbi:LLM class flavin-dependent oxidoreductase [Kitasatospora sp. NPDC091207]|uniref:LLM class flavin-dependent oxidoreductase n=1 Tax=Kitasatospora sp. NPDC091207 TaxID=3364083 RepID=UPI00382CE182